MRFFDDLAKLRELGRSKKKREKVPGLWHIFRLFGRHYKKYWGQITFSLSSLLISVGIVVLEPWPLKIVLDYIILKEPLPENLFFLQPYLETDPKGLLIFMAVVIILLAVLQAIFSYFDKFGVSRVGEFMTADIRERVFAHLQRLSLSFHDTSKSGDLVYLMTNDVPKIKKILISLPQDVLQYSITIIWMTVVMAILDWQLTLIAFSVAPFLFIFTQLFGAGMNKAMKRRRKKEGQVASILSENINAMALVQAYGQESAELERFEKENQKSLAAKLRMLRLFKTYGRVADVFVIISMSAVLYYGGHFALGLTILPGTLVLFVAYMKKIFGLVMKFSELLMQLSEARASSSRLVELVETDITIQDSPDAVDATQIKGKIDFKNVHFAYKKGEDVIKDLSFSISPGEFVALVGHSGAGKSTLISMLLRFYDPQSGQILIDDEDIHTFTIKSLRNQITILLQDAKLFHTTVRENIAFGKPGASEAEVIAAAKQAEAHDFIMEMPQGYDTIINEGGANLSGGQRQRINIARAIIRDKPIIILDEPITGLDAAAEAKVNEAMKHLTEGKTTFIIAHKFSSIVNADKILLLEQGELASIGNHHQLMDNNQKYQELYQLQFGMQNGSKHKAAAIS